MALLAGVLRLAAVATAGHGPVLDAAAIDVFDAWLASSDAIVVVVVLDGLRADALTARGPTGRMLMPRLQELAGSSLVYEDCLSDAVQPSAGLFALLTGKDPLDYLRLPRSGGSPDEAGTDPAAAAQAAPGAAGFGALVAAGFRPHVLLLPTDVASDERLLTAVPWLAASAAGLPGAPGEDHANGKGQKKERGGRPGVTGRSQRGRYLAGKDASRMSASLQRLDAELRAMAQERSRELLVVVGDALLPPYVVVDSVLTRLDPQPWAGGELGRTMEQLHANRLARARALARREPPPPRTGSTYPDPDYEWVVQAAHAEADRWLGHLLDALADNGLMPRTSLVLTATSGTSLGDRGVKGVGHDVVAGQARVPLVWQLPPGVRSRRRKGASAGASTRLPATPADVAATFAAHLSDAHPTLSPRWDLLAAEPAARTRWSYAFGPRSGPSLLPPRPRSRTRRSRRLPRSYGQVRLSTADLTLLGHSPGRALLFDRRLDPREWVDLAPAEPALVRDLHRQVLHHLYGEAPRLLLVFKGREDADIVMGVVQLTEPTGRVFGRNLEEVDRVESAGAGRWRLALAAEEAGDALVLTLAGHDPTPALELRSARDDSPWPLYPGGMEPALRADGRPLATYGSALLRAAVTTRVRDVLASVDALPWGVSLFVIRGPAQPPE